MNKKRHSLCARVVRGGMCLLLAVKSRGSYMQQEMEVSPLVPHQRLALPVCKIK